MATMSEDAVKPAVAEKKSQLEGKWGKKVIEAGYTSIPDVLIRYQRRLKLKPLDINVLLHVLSYWWKAGNLPRPSKVTIATAINVTPSTVRRCLKKLESLGYMTRIEHRKSYGSRPNEYNPAGLVKALQPLALEELEEIRKRKARHIDKLAGKKPKPSLQVVK
jgi:predicted transcriptional regulator